MSSSSIWTDGGRGPCQGRQVAARLPQRAWQRYSAGEGARGHRYYDWAWLDELP